VLLIYDEIAVLHMCGNGVVINRYLHPRVRLATRAMTDGDGVVPSACCTDRRYTCEQDGKGDEQSG
jgi:hypothetical protein